MNDLTVLITKLRNKEFIYSALERSGRLVEAEAKKKCPSVYAILKGSISHHREGNVEHIGTNNPYAMYVEYGTGIHAKNGNGRKTPWAYIVRGAYAEKYWSPEKKNCFMDAEGNKWIRTRGQKPQPYLENALKENAKKIYEIFGEEFKGV